MHVSSTKLNQPTVHSLLNHSHLSHFQNSKPTEITKTAMPDQQSYQNRQIMVSMLKTPTTTELGEKPPRSLRPTFNRSPTRTHSQNKQKKSLELEMEAASNHEPEARHDWAIQ
jgi:hypothetical protein